ncbi:MAG: DUF1223 domain-containing protein [Pseudomonadota bacterium]
MTIFRGKLWIAAAMMFAAPFAVKAETHQPRAVVELFTSQGCNSCPPADKILASYAESKDVLALSWHVDYWNYLGWKDTFSKAEFTDRQRRYAISMRRRQIYTPQAVVNGLDHVVGSRGGDLRNMIRAHEKAGKSPNVPISVQHNGNSIKVDIQSDDAAHADATLWMVYFNRSGKVKIARGENRGKTITYHNVVRGTQMLGMLKAGQFSVELHAGELGRMGHDACALILQKTTPEGTPGAIIGAAVIKDLNS